MTSMKTLRRCYDIVQAESLRTRLDAAGIMAVVNGAESHTTLSYVGGALGGIKLEVAPEDYQRADELLHADALLAAELGPWICNDCKEHNESTFEVCWHCSKKRDDSDVAPESTTSLSDSAEAYDSLTSDVSRNETINDSENPYRAVHLNEGKPKNRLYGKPTDSQGNDDLHSIVDRAYRASVFSIVLLPPLLNLYSLTLLLINPSVHFVPAYRSRVRLTWLINLIVIGLVAMIWRFLWPGVFSFWS